MDITPYIVTGISLVASVSAAIISSITNKKNSEKALDEQRIQNDKLLKSNLIVKERIQRIHEIRNLTSEYLSTASRINSIIFFLVAAIENESKEEYRKLIDEFIEVRNKTNELHFKVRLYFNGEQNEKKIVPLIEDIQKNYVDFIQYENEIGEEQFINPSYINEFEHTDSTYMGVLTSEFSDYLSNEWNLVNEELEK